MNKGPKIEISVIVATYNRAEKVNALIDHFNDQMIIDGYIDLELIIVDNNSSDSTMEIVNRQISRISRFKLLYSFESCQGLSFARNNGIEKSSKEWLFFLDDDALPEKSFFKNLYDHYRTVCDIEVFCCKVKTYHKQFPVWLKDEGPYKIVLPGDFDCGGASRLLTDKDDAPIGSSLIIKKRIFKTIGNFNIHYGYNAAKFMMVGGEDTDLINRIKAGQINIYYLSNCIVHHYPKIIKTEYRTLCKIYLGRGYFYGSNERNHKQSYDKKFIFPFWYYKEYFSTLFRCLYFLIKNNSIAARYYFLYFTKISGRFYGYVRAINSLEDERRN